MPSILGLRCVRCGFEHAAPGPRDPLRYACTACGANLEVVHDLALLKKRVTRATLAANTERTLWRYADLYPVSGGPHVARLAAGGTPLLDAPRLAREVDHERLWIKDDSRNPSASFKDRAGAVALAVALERSEKLVAGASTGNAASSLACLAARTGTRTLIFVPESAPPAKVAQILLFGAQVVAVRGTYDQAFDLCAAACAKHGWYNRNTGANPYTREGKKSCAFEIAEQLAWDAPDLVFVGTGDGNILSGLWKGFSELVALGLCERAPRMVAVQSGESLAIQRAFDGDGVLRPVSGNTIADSISVSIPRDGDAALSALRASNGFAVAVSDDELLAAMRTLARSEGVFAEPAAAASLAGFTKARKLGRVRANDRVVLVVTGSGLKDVQSARRAAGEPHVIDPELGALDALLRAGKLRA
ncbi:MAG: threonine synthase [Planctomycetes bacterium]|nr:threonine synthase [Planctomycetota bacterium]